MEVKPIAGAKWLQIEMRTMLAIVRGRKRKREASEKRKKCIQEPSLFFFFLVNGFTKYDSCRDCGKIRKVRAFQIVDG